MKVNVLGVGLYGPGLDGWTNSAPVLSDTVGYASGTPPALQATLLPPNERRRAGRTVQLAVKVAQEAIEHAQTTPGSVPTVFASSGGDLETVHELCVALAQPQKAISPTRFHNSVHNAPAGYWSIAAAARGASTSLSCFDDTFAAGLIEAVCQIQAGAQMVLLVAYDYPAPPPLHAKRPLPAPVGVALLLGKDETTTGSATLALALGEKQAETLLANAELERIRRAVPAARALPLLRALAGDQAEVVTISYLDTSSLKLDVQPCR